MEQLREKEGGEEERSVRRVKLIVSSTTGPSGMKQEKEVGGESGKEGRINSAVLEDSKVQCSVAHLNSGSCLFCIFQHTRFGICHSHL